MSRFDFAIVGAGIAGASLASELAGEASVLLLEAEDQPGYHSTGRSAAFWTETYGGPLVQPLTTASHQFLAQPGPDFSERSFLSARGALNVGRTEHRALAERFMADFADTEVAMDAWTREQATGIVPWLTEQWQHFVYEPDCCDIDVAALHAAYLKDGRKKGAALHCHARVTAISRIDGGWRITAGGDEHEATVLINAAGAWVDEVAALANVSPIGIEPKIRTMVQIETEPAADPGMPLVVALDGSFYFKPEAGGSFWLSPHDEIPSPPADVAPEEVGIATAIDRFQNVMDVQVRRVSRKWAGLRSFAPDRIPVIGFDAGEPDFFWFAGQGGFGIQTAPAAAKLARAQLLDQSPDPCLGSVDPGLYRADRFQ